MTGRFRKLISQNRALYVAFLSALLTACAPTTVVKRGQPFVLDKKSVVLLTTDNQLDATVVRLEGDSLVVTQKKAHSDMRVPLTRVRRVVKIDRAADAERSAVMGLVVGAAFMAAGEAVRPDRRNCDDTPEPAAIVFVECSEISKGTEIAISGVFGGLIGVSAGALYGLMRGEGRRYRFELPPGVSLEDD